MRDQAQVELYCRPNPLVLWVRVGRINQEGPLKFGDVSLEQTIASFPVSYLEKWDGVVIQTPRS